MPMLGEGDKETGGTWPNEGKDEKTKNKTSFVKSKDPADYGEVLKDSEGKPIRRSPEQERRWTIKKLIGKDPTLSTEIEKFKKRIRCLAPFPCDLVVSEFESFLEYATMPDASVYASAMLGSTGLLNLAVCVRLHAMCLPTFQCMAPQAVDWGGPGKPRHPFDVPCRERGSGADVDRVRKSEPSRCCPEHGECECHRDGSVSLGGPENSALRDVELATTWALIQKGDRASSLFWFSALALRNLVEMSDQDSVT